ncbi:MAG: hypothetical protein MUC36_16195 [Planctomycetes bacterium]|jgi:hypothetical protein|nr:hypothetical protein [Planctomycetota bacterium]
MKVLLVGLVWLATCLPAQAAPNDAELDAALARYRELGLPEPPAAAPFVILQGTGVSYLNGVRQENPLHPAFRLEATADGAQPYLRGTLIDTDNYVQIDVEPLSKPPEVDKLATNSWFDDFERDQGLAIGLQLWARGAKNLARQLILRGANGKLLADRVALLAADHWYAQVIESEVPLPEIQRRLQAAVALLPDSMPAGNNHPFRQMPPWTTVLEQLERTNRPPTTPPDPMTKLVLDLVHSRHHAGMGHSDAPDAPFEAVVRQGFAIVPALLAHLDDARMTRAQMGGMHKFRSYIRPLGEIADDALQQIAGGAIQLRGLNPPRVDRDAAAAWWKEARTRQEDEYLVERFLCAPSDFDRQGPLRILAAKFPERLELAVIELVEQHPDRVAHLVVDTIADGSMRKQKKSELLQRIAAVKEQRLHALRRLADVDEPRFCVLLLEVLQNAPSKTPSSVWTSPDADFGHLVILTPQPEVWQEFLRAARRAEVGLRMEYMGMFTYRYVGDRQRRQRIACLAAFLDDEESYDVAASGQTGPHAAFTFRQLTMRDFAASKLAALLGLDRHGAPEWNSEQWAALRAEVRLALAKSGIEPMQLPATDGK